MFMFSWCLNTIKTPTIVASVHFRLISQSYLFILIFVFWCIAVQILWCPCKYTCMPMSCLLFHSSDMLGTVYTTVFIMLTSYCPFVLSFHYMDTLLLDSTHFLCPKLWNHLLIVHILKLCVCFSLCSYFFAWYLSDRLFSWSCSTVF